MTTGHSKTGFPKIDEMMRGGIPVGQLVCFAAHRAPGDPPKSIIQPCFRQGAKVLYLNMESTNTEAQF